VTAPIPPDPPPTSNNGTQASDGTPRSAWIDGASSTRAGWDSPITPPSTRPTSRSSTCSTPTAGGLTPDLPAPPARLSGLRLGLAQGWLFLVSAELIASSVGLGFLLIDSQNTGRTDILLLAIVLLAVLGKITDGVLGLAERRLLRRWN
jgi:hypothetical protein